MPSILLVAARESKEQAWLALGAAERECAKLGTAKRRTFQSEDTDHGAEVGRFPKSDDSDGKSFARSKEGMIGTMKQNR
jgi:hypothetical protein